MSADWTQISYSVDSKNKQTNKRKKTHSVQYFLCCINTEWLDRSHIIIKCDNLNVNNRTTKHLITCRYFYEYPCSNYTISFIEWEHIIDRAIVPCTLYIAQVFAFPSLCQHISNVLLHPSTEPLNLEIQYNREVLLHHTIEMHYKSNIWASIDNIETLVKSGFAFHTTVT